MKRFVLIALFIAAGISAIGYRLFTPIVTVRYRLAIEAEVDGKAIVGSGIREVTYAKAAQLLSNADYGANYRGEAVVVDLGSKGQLFALLKAGEDSRSGPDYILLRGFGFDGGALPRPVEKGISEVNRLTGKVDLPLASLPMLVRFRDATEPLTIEKIDPLNIEKSFGSGTKLTRASLEIISAKLWPWSLVGMGEPITQSLSKKLVWLPLYYDRRLDGQRFGTIDAPNRLANSLSSGAFKAGLD